MTKILVIDDDPHQAEISPDILGLQGYSALVRFDASRLLCDLAEL